jgi:hypothetical protein
MLQVFETPTLVVVGVVRDVVLRKEVTDMFDDSTGSQPSTSQNTTLDMD